MRCKNCGWPNKPSETRCIKCNSPLSSDDTNMNYAEADDMSQSSRPLNKTVFEDDVFSAKETHNDAHHVGQTRVESTEENLSQCPKCGYPLRSGVDKCPNCKFQINSTNHASHNQSSGYQNGNDSRQADHHRPTRMVTEQGSKSNYRGTINPYMMNLTAEPTFVLKPIKRIDERHEFDEQEYEGKQVVLNRDNTEQNNPSITSREQAIITSVDGRWFIEDKSDQKTTFVQAAQKIELHDGDIILLGNRLFEFHK